MDYNTDELDCFSVHESTFEYEAFDWENFTSSDCNCSHAMHSYLAVCEGICESISPSLPPFAEVAAPAALYLMVFLVGTIGNALHRRFVPHLVLRSDNGSSLSNFYSSFNLLVIELSLISGEYQLNHKNHHKKFTSSFSKL
uniref:G-protein coupled receptors family 1 profile domain-containing protein n=1 Tax=Parascaris equorum TaxID=6256 RepID=A0A914S330_PAREQ